MSQVIRAMGVFLLVGMIYGLATSSVTPDKTRILIFVVVTLIMITIGYLGDIRDSIQENTQALKTMVDKKD